MKNKRVVITGIGPFASPGTGKNALWEGIMSGHTGLTKETFTLEGEVVGQAYIHKIDYFDIRNFEINEKVLNEIKVWKDGDEVMDLYYLMAAVKLALNDSRMEINEENNKTTGLVLSLENPGLEHYTNTMISSIIPILKELTHNNNGFMVKDLFDRLYKQLKKRGYETQSFMYLYHVCKAFDIHGFSLFTNNACASGQYALETARLMIEGGNNNVVIVAAADYPDVYKYLWFKTLNMYPEDGLTMPFDKDAHGFALGHGGVGLVLEEMEHALRRRAYIYAEYKGGGFLMEGWKVAFPDCKGSAYRETVLQALESSNMTSDDIDLICMHGVGTKVADTYESDTIAKLFGTNHERPKIIAFKPYIGHTLGASSLLETTIMLLAMENNTLPPMLNSKNLNKKIRIRPVMDKQVTPIRNALKVCSAFAGFNSSSIFQKFGDSK